MTVSSLATGPLSSSTIVPMPVVVWIVASVAFDRLSMKRQASTERMLNAAGQPIKDVSVEMSVAELKQRVQGTAGGASK